MKVTEYAVWVIKKVHESPLSPDEIPAAEKLYGAGTTMRRRVEPYGKNEYQTREAAVSERDFLRERNRRLIARGAQTGVTDYWLVKRTVIEEFDDPVPNSRTDAKEG